MPGGVNSPVRAFAAVGGKPIFIAEARGAELVGADGRRFVDYVGSWGPMIVGHTHREVVLALQRAAERGTSYGAPTEGEVRFAEAIRDAMPSIEMLRMTSSGTEAEPIRCHRPDPGRSTQTEGAGRITQADRVESGRRCRGHRNANRRRA